jgi:TonB family protein
MKQSFFPCLLCCIVFALLSLTGQGQTASPTPTPGAGISVGAGPNTGKPVGGGGPGPQTGPIDYSRPFSAKEVQQKAVLLTKPEPVYTEEAKKNQTEGSVRLRVLLAVDGTVTSITPVIRLPDGLTEMAIAAARKIRFRPARKDGREVSQWIQIEYYFSLFARKGDPDFGKDAEITWQPAAEYTEQARAKGVIGKVILDVGLDPSGNVFVIKVIKGLPEGLTEQAIKAANEIKFKPAISKAGQAMLQAQTVEYEFKLP